MGFKHFVTHVYWCRHFFKYVPFYASECFVIVSIPVDCLNSDLVIILVNRSRWTCKFSFHKDGWNVQNGTPSYERASNVEVFFIQTVTGSSFIITDVPCCCDGLEYRCRICEEQVSSWVLTNVRIFHVDIEVSTTIVFLCYEEWIRIKYVNSHCVCVRIVLIDCIDCYSM